jgi:hypothetical protein
MRFRGVGGWRWVNDQRGPFARHSSTRCVDEQSGPTRFVSAWAGRYASPALPSQDFEDLGLRVGADLHEVGSGKPICRWTQVLTFTGGGQNGEKLVSGNLAGPQAS